MARAPFQVLVLPYRWRGPVIEYAVFRRADLGVWQGIAGGGEGREMPDDAARREAFEEAGIAQSSAFQPLASTTAISVTHFADRHGWDPALETIPEYSFGVDVDEQRLRMSTAHTEIRWVDLRGGLALLEWESNQTALRELDALLTRRAV